MTRRRLAPLVAVPILLAGPAGVAGCGSDVETGDATTTTHDGNAGSTDVGDDVEKAIDAVGQDEVLEITAEQLVGNFGLTDYRIDDGRLVMLSEQTPDQAEAQCLQARIVLDGVGSSAPVSIGYDDSTIDCEEFS